MVYKLTLYAVFAIAVAIEMYFFLMQRVPLEVGREHAIRSRIAREMLPTWSALVWLAKIGKWVLVVLVWRAAGWLPAIICVAIPLVVSARVPVPYTHFTNLLETNLKSQLRTNPLLAAELLAALHASRAKHGF
jgi:hypothetical protein